MKEEEGMVWQPWLGVLSLGILWISLLHRCLISLCGQNQKMREKSLGIKPAVTAYYQFYININLSAVLPIFFLYKLTIFLYINFFHQNCGLGICKIFLHRVSIYLVDIISILPQSFHGPLSLRALLFLLSSLL